MKPWEEDWKADVSRLGYSGALVETPGGRGVFAVYPDNSPDGWTEADADDAARAKLAAQAPAVARILLSLQKFRCGGDWCGGCPVCGGVGPLMAPHTEDCELVTVLQAAGVPLLTTGKGEP